LDVLAGIVKSVLVIIILASFMEVILPEGNLKPFVRFAIGLFLIIAILNPVLNVLFEDRSFKVNLWDYQLSSEEQEKEILERGNHINQQLLNSGNNNLHEKVQGQISALAMLVPGVKEVQTQATLNDEGELAKIVLLVQPEDPAQLQQEDNEVKGFLEGGDPIQKLSREQIEEKIRGVIHNLYGFKDIEIEIEFKGG